MEKSGTSGKTDQIVAKGKKGDAALSLFIGEMEELLPWFTGKEFTGLTIKRKEEGWMLIVRGAANGSHKVAFSEAKTVKGLYRNLYRTVVYDKGYWKEDKFRKGT